MSKSPISKSSRNFLKSTALATCGIAAAAILATPLVTATPSSVYAEPVKIVAPQAPSFADVVEAVRPAVVSVRVEAAFQPASNNGTHRFGEGFGGFPKNHPFNDFFKRFGDQFGQEFGNRRGQRDGNKRRGNSPRFAPRRFGMSQGSGFFVSDDGYIVTNNHVIENGSKFTVVADDGTEYDAELVGADPRTDLAVLKIKSDKEFTYVDFANDKATRIGDWVVAVGNPFGLGGTVTAGIISARGRDIGAGRYDDFIQIDAAVNKGNSGGPAFNLSGEVIGVNTAIFSPSGGNVGIAFAIPSDIAKEIVLDLIDDGQVVRGWLGVQIQPVNEDIAAALGLEEANGAIVTEPQPESPADRAGILSGDVIVAVEGNPVSGPKELARVIGEIAPDTDTAISVWRDGQIKQMTIRLGRLAEDQKVASAEPSKPAATNLGLDLRDTDEGPTVADVDPESQAYRKGIRPGDVLLSVGGIAVEEVADVADAVAAVRDNNRSSALLQIRSGKNSRFVALSVEDQRG